MGDVKESINRWVFKSYKLHFAILISFCKDEWDDACMHGIFAKSEAFESA